MIISREDESHSKFCFWLELPLNGICIMCVDPA